MKPMSVIGERIGRLTVTGPCYFRRVEGYGFRLLHAGLVCDCGARVSPRILARLRSMKKRGSVVQCGYCRSQDAYRRWGTMTDRQAAEILARME